MNSEIGRFLKQVGIGIVVGGAAAAYVVSQSAEEGLGTAVAVGCGIALLNAVAGCFSAMWAFDKSQQAFMKALFGGMAARILLMGAAFGLLIFLTEIHETGLTFSLFGFYVLFQILEVRFLVSHFGNRNRTE